MANPIADQKEAIFAEEAFVVDVQILLNRIMKEKDFSRADLARAMNVSRARITQIFSDDCKNFTVRLLARAMHAMEETPELICKLHLDELRSKWERQSRQRAKASYSVARAWDDDTDTQDICWPANDNRMAGLARHYGMAA